MTIPRRFVLIVITWKFVSCEILRYEFIDIFDVTFMITVELESSHLPRNSSLILSRGAGFKWCSQQILSRLSLKHSLVTFDTATFFDGDGHTKERHFLLQSSGIDHADSQSLVVNIRLYYSWSKSIFHNGVQYRIHFFYSLYIWVDCIVARDLFFSISETHEWFCLSMYSVIQKEGGKI